MVPNAGFWALFLRETYIPTIDAFRATLTKRIVDSFAQIEKDAEAFAEAEYDRLSHTPSDGSVDLGDIAEKVQDTAVIYYQTLHGLRQGALNLLAAGLFHLLEQQQQAFLSDHLPPQGDRLRFNDFLLDHGIDCASFSSAPDIHELRLVANVAKHGAGRSAKELVKVRPDLFEPEGIPAPSPAGETPSQRTVSASSTSMSPISSDDLYVSTEDLSNWCGAVKAFWEELSVHLQKKQHGEE